MKTVIEAGRRAAEFVKKTMHADSTRVIKAGRGESGWEIEVETYEESAFIKSLGLPSRVRDRAVYLVNLDDELNVQSYERSTT